MIRNYNLNYTKAWYNDFVSQLNSKVVYKKVYSEAKGKCKLCGKQKPSKVYPIVEHDHPNKAIVIKRLIAICNDCNHYHSVSTLSEDEQGVVDYLMELLRQTKDDTTTMINEAYERYTMSYKYSLDFSEIDDTEWIGYKSIPSKF